MPELPDVEVIKQYIDATFLHKKITRAEVKDDSVLDIASQTLRKQNFILKIFPVKNGSRITPGGCTSISTMM